MRTLAASLLLLCLAGCGLSPITESEIAVGEIEVMASTRDLERAMGREISRLTLSGRDSYVLHLDERLDVQPTSITSEGRASKRRLRYELTWRLEGAGPASDSGNYRYSQVLANDDTNHRADRLADRRFADQARLDGVSSVIKNLIHGGGR